VQCQIKRPSVWSASTLIAVVLIVVGVLLLIELRSLFLSALG
jgi:hypothetical protein